jgi:hypothetical protein
MASRIERVLTVVHNILEYLVSALCPSSGWIPTKPEYMASALDRIHIYLILKVVVLVVITVHCKL